MQVNHASVYPDPVLCLGMSGDGVTLAVGLSSGLLVTRQRKTRSAESVQKVGWDPRLPGVKARKRPVRVPKLTPAHFRYFTRGKSEKAAVSDSLYLKSISFRKSASLLFVWLTLEAGRGLPRSSEKAGTPGSP